MRLREYKQMLASVEAFSGQIWAKILTSCFFLPTNDNWKEWANPWGNKLVFYKKNFKPKSSKEEIEIENIKIWDPFFWLPKENILQRSQKSWGGIYHDINWMYIYDGEFVKLYQEDQVQNPYMHGYKMIYNGFSEKKIKVDGWKNIYYPSK